MPTRMQSPSGLVLITMVALWAAPAVAQAQSKPLAPAGGPSAAKPGGAKQAAASKATPATNPEEGLRQVITAYSRAVSQGDLAAMAKFWTADGVYVDPGGRHVTAKEALEKGTSDEHGPSLALETETLRMVTPEVAIEEGICELKPEGEKPFSAGTSRPSGSSSKGRGC